MSMPSTGIAPARAPAFLSAGAMPFWLAALLAAALFGALDLAIDSHRILRLLGDTDDATRLVQVRDLIAGSPWTDTTIHRIGAPEPLHSHWSRLIDLPIAALILLLKPFAGMAWAETITRFVWPLMVLWPALLLIGREAEQRGGRRAGYIAIVLAGTALNALVQFMPGRIDHHNVMILGAVSGTLMLTRSLTEPRLGWPAGAMLGLGTAIGYEALALTAASVSLIGLCALVTGRGLGGVARAAAAMTLTLAVALVVTTAPQNLLNSHCDALSLNLVLLAAAGAAGLAVVNWRGQGWAPMTRLGAVGIAAGIGLVAYACAQPACLKGPFGELDPALGPLWLSSVVETQNILYLLKTSAVSALVFIVFAAMGLGAATIDWLRLRSLDAALPLVILAVAIALAFWQIKLIAYATFLAVNPIALTMARIGVVERPAGVISGSGRRLLAVASLNQLFLLVVLSPIALLLPADGNNAVWQSKVKDCIATEASAALAELPAGLALADRDLAPFVVASTQLSVTAAPYHRLDRAIITNVRIFGGSVEAAEAGLKRLGASYVAVCEGMAESTEDVPEPAAGQGSGKPLGFRAQLIAGQTPAFLEPVTLAKATPIKVWRVR